MRFYYYSDDRLFRIANVCIIYDNDRIFIISDHKDNLSNNIRGILGKNPTPEEEKANLIEYFSQTGSFYKHQKKYLVSRNL